MSECGYAEIGERALRLPVSDRNRLIERLMDSLDGGEGGGRWIDVAAERAWMAEIQRRSEAIDRGEARLIDHEEVMASFFARFGGSAKDVA